MTKDTIHGLKADLKAANDEVRSVMDRNIELRKQAESAYQDGYRDALQALDNLSRIAQSQAGIITYLMQMLVGGLKQRG